MFWFKKRNTLFLLPRAFYHSRDWQCNPILNWDPLINGILCHWPVL
jgi:hypothetical protein